MTPAPPRPALGASAVAEPHPCPQYPRQPTPRPVLGASAVAEPHPCPQCRGGGGVGSGSGGGDREPREPVGTAGAGADRAAGALVRAAVEAAADDRGVHVPVAAGPTVGRGRRPVAAVPPRRDLLAGAGGDRGRGGGPGPALPAGACRAGRPHDPADGRLRVDAGRRAGPDPARARPPRGRRAGRHDVARPGDLGGRGRGAGPGAAVGVVRRGRGAGRAAGRAARARARRPARRLHAGVRTATPRPGHRGAPADRRRAARRGPRRRPARPAGHRRGHAPPQPRHHPAAGGAGRGGVLAGLRRGAQLRPGGVHRRAGPRGRGHHRGVRTLPAAAPWQRRPGAVGHRRGRGRALGGGHARGPGPHRPGPRGRAERGRPRLRAAVLAPRGGGHAGDTGQRVPRGGAVLDPGHHRRRGRPGPADLRRHRPAGGGPPPRPVPATRAVAAGRPDRLARRHHRRRRGRAPDRWRSRPTATSCSPTWTCPRSPSRRPPRWRPRR